MPDIHTSFTNREVLEALRKAGWGHLLPAYSDLENPDEVCVEFTTSTEDSTNDEDDEDDDETCDESLADTDEDDNAVEPKKIQQVWDSLDD